MNALTSQQELCEFRDSAPIQLAMGEHQKRVEATITSHAVEKISPGCVISLGGIATFRQGTDLRYVPINMTTVAYIEEFDSGAISIAEYRKQRESDKL